MRQSNQKSTMNHDFLIAATQLNQALEKQKTSGSACMGMTRRTFIRRTGSATVATVVACNLADRAYAGAYGPDKIKVSFRFRLYVSEAPERNDAIVSWSTTSANGTTNTPTPHEWKVLGDGPQPADEAFGQLKPIKATVTATGGFANGTEQIVPELRRNGGLYGGEWIIDKTDRPRTNFNHSGGLDQSSQFTVLNISGTTIDAGLAMTGVIWKGLSMTVKQTNNAAEKHTTDDGHSFGGDAGVKAHYDGQISTGASLRKADITAETVMQSGLGFEGNAHGQRESKWQKQTDQNDATAYVKTQEIGHEVNANFTCRWVIQVQRQTLTKTYSPDGAGSYNLAGSVLSEWETIEQHPKSK
jgi:hypothetical protein